MSVQNNPMRLICTEHDACPTNSTNSDLRYLLSYKKNGEIINSKNKRMIQSMNVV